MMYRIKRGDQEFGPYSGNDIQQYLATGNIVDTDMVCAEGTDRWIPVKEILSRRAGAGSPQASTPPASAAQPAAPTPSYSPQPSRPQTDPMFDPAPAAQAPSFSTTSEPVFPSATPPSTPAWGAAPGTGSGPAMNPGSPSNTMKNGAPLPPDMNWVIVLVISLLCGIFALVWFIMQILWVKKIDAQNKTLPKILTGIGILIAGVVLSMLFGVVLGDTIGGLLGMLVYLCGFAGYIFFLITGVLDMKKSLEGYFNAVEPINLKLNPILMIFFCVFYTQYHFNRINVWKRTGVLPQ